jgi:hypothetical protein
MPDFQELMDQAMSTSDTYARHALMTLEEYALPPEVEGRLASAMVISSTIDFCVAALIKHLSDRDA